MDMTIALLSMLTFLTGCAQFSFPEMDRHDGDSAKVRKHSAIVQDLINILDNNPHFLAALQEALAYEGRRPDNYWHAKTVDDMYVFFDAWLKFLPLVANVRQYSDAFGAFYTNCPQDNSECGIYIDSVLTLVREEPFRNWMGRFVTARGQFMDSPESAINIQEWMQDPAINIDDYVVPPGGFTSFNHFFTRELKPGKRLVEGRDNTSVLVSPADCDIFPVVLDLSADAEIKVKGMNLNVSELLGGNSLAESFVGGKGVLLTLQATYYHHFHAPVDGTIKAAEFAKGLYFGARGFPQGFLAERHRGYFILQTDKYGLVGMVPVGIATISSVEFSCSVGDTVTKGDELGRFAYGGSAIVLLFQKDRLTLTGKNKVIMGEQIGSLK